ncbi:hypothetical protein D3C85_1640890 [compost metagenome]
MGREVDVHPPLLLSLSHGVPVLAVLSNVFDDEMGIEDEMLGVDPRAWVLAQQERAAWHDASQIAAGLCALAMRAQGLHPKQGDQPAFV